MTLSLHAAQELIDSCQGQGALDNEPAVSNFNVLAAVTGLQAS